MNRYLTLVWESFAMPSAAVWSAVAATFSALAALLTMLIHRRNLMESARPELVVTGWARNPPGQGHASAETVKFSKIRNVGRGSALHVFLKCSQIVDGRPVVTLPSTRLAIVAP